MTDNNTLHCGPPVVMVVITTLRKVSVDAPMVLKFGIVCNSWQAQVLLFVDGST